MATNNIRKFSNIKIPEKFTISKVITYVSYAWVYLGIFTLTLRIFLLATSANLSNSFSQFIIRTSSDYLRPFAGIFSPANITGNGYLDVTALFAIIIYLFIAWGIKGLIAYINNRIDLYVERRAASKSSAPIKSSRTSRD